VAPNEDTNMVFGDIVENCLIDVWQRTQLEIMNHDDKLFEEEPQISDMPQGMIVQYIPQGLIIFFGKQEDIDGY
jgi:hypothetical protein